MKNIAPSDIKGISDLILKARSIVITTHVHPDGDAMGSSLGLRHYLLNKGKQATVIIPDAFGESLDFMLAEGDRDYIAVTKNEKERCVDEVAKADLIFALDMNSFTRAEGLTEELYKATCPKILIDHHINPDRDAFDITVSSEEVSSACEVLYYVLLSMPDVNSDPAALPRQCATMLMTGMTTDSNNFANSVYPSTLAMASGLLEAGVDRDWIIGNLYQRYREERLRLMGYLLSQKMKITPLGVAYMVLDKKEMEAFDVREGDTESFVNLPLGMEKVRMSIFIKEDAGYARVSIRSKAGTSANALAKTYFHGGGHFLASGGRLFMPEDISDISEAGAYIETVTEKFFNDEN
ncbi:MAG: DHH family phosphoesterase [Bacteroidales bacterium]|nr:DHH family phosphoesterase [Bacteroidales bacterium]